MEAGEIRERRRSSNEQNEWFVCDFEYAYLCIGQVCAFDLLKAEQSMVFDEAKGSVCFLRLSMGNYGRSCINCEKTEKLLPLGIY